VWDRWGVGSRNLVSATSNTVNRQVFLNSFFYEMGTVRDKKWTIPFPTHPLYIRRVGGGRRAHATFFSDKERTLIFMTAGIEMCPDMRQESCPLCPNFRGLQRPFCFCHSTSVHFAPVQCAESVGLTCEI